MKDPNQFHGFFLEQNAAYLILRGLKTLNLRVNQQNRTALQLSQALEAHPKVHIHVAF
jgi:cystathionine gamma-synthase